MIFSYMTNLKNIPVIGPDKSAARLEGSKDFAKDFLDKAQDTNCYYKSFDKSTLEGGSGFPENTYPPYVIKADGLAAGKGVLIIDDIHEAAREADAIIEWQVRSCRTKSSD